MASELIQEDGMWDGILKALGFGCLVVVNGCLRPLCVEDEKSVFIVESLEEATSFIVRLRSYRDRLKRYLELLISTLEA